MQQPISCAILGHRFAFRTEGALMLWACERCGEGSTKQYASAAEATRYASALDRRPNADLGKRAPLIGMLPMRLWRKWRDLRG